MTSDSGVTGALDALSTDVSQDGSNRTVNTRERPETTDEGASLSLLQGSDLPFS